MSMGAGLAIGLATGFALGSDDTTEDDLESEREANTRLRAANEALGNLVVWYEAEMGRAGYADADVPPALAVLEKALKTARDGEK